MSGARGMTMLELLMALAILSALVLTLAAWTRVAGDLSAASAAEMRWRHAAEAVLALVHDDLAAGDLQGDQDQERVEIKDTVLRISTRPTTEGDIRGRGLVRHRYLLDPLSARLALESMTDRDERRTRPLIDGVGGWVCEIDEERSVLRVTIESVEGTALTRSYHLP